MKIVLDTETTGFKPTVDDITQLTFIVLDDNNKIVGFFNKWFKTDKVISPEVVKVTGVDNKKLNELSKGEYFESLASQKKVLNILNSNCEVIGHNIRYDRDMLIGNCMRYLGFNPSMTNTFCTMKKSTDIIQLPPKQGSKVTYKSPKLCEAVDWVKRKSNLTDDGIMKFAQKVWKDNQLNFHDARYDVICTYLVYVSLQELQKNTGF